MELEDGRGAVEYAHADLAAACKEAARLQIALGRTEPAERNLRRAIRLLEELNVEASDDPEPRGVLAASFDLLGLLLRRDLPAHGEEAASCGRRAVALSERLVRDFPAEAHRKFNLAQACDNLGTLHRVQRGGSTVELYERSLNLLRELHRASPERVQFAVSLAETCSNLGSLHWGNNRLEKADELFKEGLAILEPLVAANPNHSWYGSSLAALRINLGSLLLTRGRTDEALQQYDRALAALQAILRREPEHAQARGDLLPAHGGRAQTLSQLGRHVDAVKDWDRVVELAPAENRQGYRLQRAAVLIQAGEFARAAAEADDVAGAPKADAADMFEAGRLHARIATETPSRAEQHASNAVAWLRKAKATGFFKTQAELGNLQQADFSELKKRAEFQTLLREATDALGKK